MPSPRRPSRCSPWAAWTPCLAPVRSSEVVDAIAAAIIDGTVREGDQVTVDVDKDGGFTVVCDNTPAATYEVPDAE